MSEGPKLYTNKPKRAQLKQREEGSPPPPPPSSSSLMGTPPPSKTPPPSQPPRESFARRYKFVWPLLLTVNIAVGAYLFMRTKKKDTDTEEEVPNVPPTPGPTTAATVAVPVSEKTLSPSPPIIEPVMLRDPMPENQQRELFKWLLEEKRKVKPKDSEEKKCIDEEKAILKQFIRAKSIPSL
ncbi:uncharacterized protein LOC130787986 isoform X1 [Actinidia eriantha]|uniref:uncharacterized protein LOC130787986 isoform X1 n=2 Tax=Actinidia eriantha TaxID=165200 RepID=UPI00258AD2A7|nr:uncharacterized protein LOC130787986 isoform X1 [Actinidia eriantha]